MNNKNFDISMNTGFAAKISGELATYPYILIKNYQRLGIDEKSLIVLLRILHPYYIKGSLSLDDVTREFSVSADEAKVILKPFLDKRLIEEYENGLYDCSGVINCYYEDWIAEKRNPQPLQKAGISGPAPKNNKLISDLAMLYRRFEQELGKNLTPIQSEEIRSWLEDDGLSADMIEEALRRSVLQEKRSFAYIKSILRKWREAGYADLHAVLDNDIKPARREGAKTGSHRSSDKRKSQYDIIYDKY